MIVGRAFAGKRFAVLGLARSGMATIAALKASGAEVVGWDVNQGPRDKAADMVALADPLESDLSGFDAVVLSPGIPLNRHPIGQHAARFGVPLIGDVELFAMARPDLPEHRLVGITGTNGKSTTTALTSHILERAGKAARATGNIGIPILSQEPLPAGGIYVFELSSYQIDLTVSLDCDVAAILNITPDHLDRYDGLNAYAASKARLCAMQRAGHLALLDRKADHEFALAQQVPSGVDSEYIDDVVLPGNPENWPSLRGPHNCENAAAAVAICRRLGLGNAVIEAGLRSFAGLPHRMERVAEIDGVLYVNDSKATNAASAAPALAAFPRIHWIVGGLPKTDTLEECTKHLSNVVAAYTIGEAGALYGDQLRDRVHVENCELLLDAVRRAAAAARPGDVVLLSPACASFDQFRDYEARGDCFKVGVAALVGDGTRMNGGKGA